jgi:pimeloyl-ACP methyl ester carboxylesterase
MVNRFYFSRRTALAGLGAAALVPQAVLARPMQAATRLVRYSDSAGRPVTTEVLLRGNGPLIVLLPSLGRGAADFDDLAGRIAAAGYRTAAINPRGIGGSQGPAAPTFADAAGDVREVIRALQSDKTIAEPAVLVGHAYGNRLARAVATWHPDAVSSLILLASGGQVAIPPAIAKALRDVFDPTQSPEAHIAAVRTAFFAPGNDPEVWREGWYGAVALEQQSAFRELSVQAWTGGGKANIYIVQAAQDVLAAPANAEALRSAYPDRVEVAILQNAGHAMLPEQPERLAELILGRLAAITKPSKPHRS